MVISERVLLVALVVFAVQTNTESRLTRHTKHHQSDGPSNRQKTNLQRIFRLLRLRLCAYEQSFWWHLSLRYLIKKLCFARIEQRVGTCAGSGLTGDSPHSLGHCLHFEALRLSGQPHRGHQLLLLPLDFLLLDLDLLPPLHHLKIRNVIFHFMKNMNSWYDWSQPDPSWIKFKFIAERNKRVNLKCRPRWKTFHYLNL